MNLTYEQVESLLVYEPETGKLFWRPRPLGLFKTKRHCNVWNALYAGKEAFTSCDNVGYRQGSLFKIKFRAHRVCWILAHGEWPKYEIDHIDGVKTNNSIRNLRDVPRSQNMKNKVVSRNNTSGLSGVTWDKKANNWVATIGINRSRKHIGSFKSRDDAVSARKAANLVYGFSERHGAAL